MKPSHVASPSPPAPTVWSHESGSPAPKVDAYSPRAQLTSPKTHDHSSSGKTAEVARVAPTQVSSIFFRPFSCGSCVVIQQFQT